VTVSRRSSSFLIVSLVAFSALGATALLTTSPPLRRGGGDSTEPNREQTRGRVESLMGELPLYFIKNEGQADPRVNFYLQAPGTSVYFTPQGMTMALSSTVGGEKSASSGPASKDGPTSRWVVRQEFVGANPNATIRGSEAAPAIVSYFKGSPEQWKTGIPTYSSVSYKDLWPGIDLTYEGTGGRLKYTFSVHPGADPADIRLAYRGAKSVRLNPTGQLEVDTPLGGLKDDRPLAWQQSAQGTQQVSALYEMQGETAYGFDVGDYDRTKTLIIDPLIIYAGYIGGSATEGGHDIAVDGSGYAYVTGFTLSPESSFPDQTGPDVSYNGDSLDSDAFVAKVNQTGTALIYAGYIGGEEFDTGFGIAVDGSGAAYITGLTKSDATTFPEIGGPDSTYNGGGDAFVVKVNASGTGLTYAGYIGGSSFERGDDIAVDSAGAAYVAGFTESDATTFPEIGGPDSTYNGGGDAFVAKVNASGTGLTYAGYIGGTGHDRGTGIAVDSSWAPYIAGVTLSTATSFPEKTGPDLSFNGGEVDGFVAKLAPAGTSVTYAGYIGGAGRDYAFDIALDTSRAAYVVGETASASATFPEKGGPDVTYNGGEADGFVAKVKPDGTGLTYAGYIGGNGNDRANGVAVDAARSAYVSGYTESTETTFPDKSGPDLTYGGNGDHFVAKVAISGGSLVYAGYIGGSGSETHDDHGGIAVDNAGAAYVVGSTNSTQSTFPDKFGPDLSHNGAQDAYVAKVAQSNLLRNSGFESDGNGDGRPDNWTSDSRFTRTATTVHTGVTAGRHSATNNSSYVIHQAVSGLKQGTTYYFEGFVKIPSTSDAFTFRIQVVWRNSSNAVISTSTVKTYTSPTILGAWNRASSAMVAPAGTTSALVRMYVQSLNATIYVDSFQFRT
jgi:hypothetical protein